MRTRIYCLCFLALTVLPTTACMASPSAAVDEAKAALTTGGTTLTVFAAASLTESFTKMAAEFEQDHPQVTVLLNFAGSQSLRLQLEHGAQSDIFASANLDHAEAVFLASLIEMPVIFSHNQIVVIVPVGNPGQIEWLADLASPGLKLVLAGPEVPAGRYAREVLVNLNTDPALPPDFSARVLANLVSEEDTVKGVVAKVQLGEADAGLVYASDITPPVVDRVLVLEIPSQFNVYADYPIARAAESKQPQLAQQFIDFVLSSRGQTILADHGFQPANP